MPEISIAGWPIEIVLSGLSAFFTVTALGMFVRAIAKKRSKPHLLAWVIRIALVAVAFLSQLAAGATYSLAMSGSQFVGGILIVCLILYMQPRLGRFSRVDRLAIIAAGIGVAIWVVSGNPLYGLLGALLADAVATALGIHASITRGARESLSFWACAFCAALAATLAATNTANILVLIAPIFSCTNAAVNIVALWYVRRFAVGYVRAPRHVVTPGKDASY